MLLLFAPLIGWRVYTRFRRLVGRQRFSEVRLQTTLVIYSVFVVTLCVVGWPHPARLGWLAGGIVLGCLLGIFGLKRTRFEPTPNGLFYTPQAHLGIALSLVFIARIIYRLVEVHAFKPAVHREPNIFAITPLTLSVFGLLAGYYVTYAIGLIRWRHRVVEAKRQREALKLEQTPPAS